MNLWTYTLRKLATIPPTVLILLFLLFLAFSIIGNPSPVSSQFPAYTGTIQSFLGAYLKFTANILTGNWGHLGSMLGQYTFSGQLSTLVTIYFFTTLQVVMIAAPVGLAISFPLSRYLGTHHTYRKAKFFRGVIVVSYLTPAYVVALLLQVALGKGVLPNNPMGIFPVTGEFSTSALPFPPPSWLGSSTGAMISQPTHLMLIDSMIHMDFPLALNLLAHLALPIITLVISIAAVVTFLLESGYVDNMGMEYVKGARAKGVPEKAIVKKHVRRNAVMPVMASATIMVAYLISNIIMMDYVFGFPGIGNFLIVTITQGQYYPTAVIIFLLSIIIIAMGIIIDIIHFIKNPVMRS